MSENPYESPSAPLTEPEPLPIRNRFRWRYIPAAICIIWGGLGTLFVLFSVVGAVQFIARVGITRMSLERVLNLTIKGIHSGMFLIAGWSWLRGQWLLALDLPVAAILVLPISLCLHYKVFDERIIHLENPSGDTGQSGKLAREMFLDPARWGFAIA
jgi:hypothetical protein